MQPRVHTILVQALKKMEVLLATLCTAEVVAQWTALFCDVELHVAGAHFLKTTLPLALSLALCNMDRIVLSVAIVPIAREFGFSIAAQV